MYTLQKLLLRVALSLIGLPRLLHWLRSSRWIGLLFLRIRWNESSPCLERSLIEIGSLARAGKKAKLAIGVQKSGEKLKAHAWAELPNESVDEQDGFKKLGAL